MRFSKTTEGMAFLSDGTFICKRQRDFRWTALHPEHKDNPAKRISVSIPKGVAFCAGPCSHALRCLRLGSAAAYELKIQIDAAPAKLWTTTRDGTVHIDTEGTESSVSVWSSGGWGNLCNDQDLVTWDPTARIERVNHLRKADGSLADPLEEALKYGTSSIKTWKTLEEAKASEAVWRGAYEPSKGMKVRATINMLGEGAIDRFFTLNGFVGILILPDNPPEWWREQNPGRTRYTLFGPETEVI